jgi:hypothetical protein
LSFEGWYLIRGGRIFGRAVLSSTGRRRRMMRKMRWTNKVRTRMRSIRARRRRRRR